jgi:hypothetical protein
MFKIEAECDKENNKFTVRVGDRWLDQLCWDEALGVLATLVIKGPEGAGLRNEEEHARFKAWLSRPIPEGKFLSTATDAELDEIHRLATQLKTKIENARIPF